MAGAGVRVFQPGEVLTAALVNTYLQDQVVARFEDVADRDGSFGGAGQPTLEEGRVCYLDSTNELQYFSGTAWVSISAEAITGNIQAKGDLVVGTAPNTVARLAAGADGLVLTTDSSTATGLVWASSGIADGSITSAKLADVIIDSKTANYTLVLTDKNKFIEMNVATPNTITIPTNASVAFPVGAQIHITQYGAGKTQIVAATPATTTIRSTPGTYLRAQYSSATLVKRATDEWYLVGDLSAT